MLSSPLNPNQLPEPELKRAAQQPKPKVHSKNKQNKDKIGVFIRSWACHNAYYRNQDAKKEAENSKAADFAIEVMKYVNNMYAEEAKGRDPEMDANIAYRKLYYQVNGVDKINMNKTQLAIHHQARVHVAAKQTWLMLKQHCFAYADVITDAELNAIMAHPDCKRRVKENEEAKRVAEEELDEDFEGGRKALELAIEEISNKLLGLGAFDD